MLLRLSPSLTTNSVRAFGKVNTIFVEPESFDCNPTEFSRVNFLII